MSAETAPPVPATDPGQHGLAQNAVSLLQTTVISIASSAPAATVTVTFAALIAASARGGAIAVLITMIPMLVIANSFRRLNAWEANCGAQYVWVGRAIGPRLGLLTGWVVLSALMFGTVATVLPVGPSLLDLLGLNASSQLGAALSATLLSLIVAILAVLGITLTARFQLTLAAIEYAAVVVLAAFGLWQTFVTHPAGFAHPSWAWLSPTGIGGAGSLSATMLVTVFMIAGWDASLYVNEETKNARVNPGKAVMISVVALGLFYALSTIAFQAVAPVSPDQRPRRGRGELRGPANRRPARRESHGLRHLAVSPGNHPDRVRGTLADSATRWAPIVSSLPRSASSTPSTGRPHSGRSSSQSSRSC